MKRNIRNKIKDGFQLFYKGFFEITKTFYYIKIMFKNPTVFSIVASILSKTEYSGHEQFLHYKKFYILSYFPIFLFYMNLLKN